MPSIFKVMYYFVLIETLWNVKVHSIDHQPTYSAVLIETLWNVKYSGGNWIAGGNSVLIETLWNVKWTVFANNLSNN